MVERCRFSFLASALASSFRRFASSFSRFCCSLACVLSSFRPIEFVEAVKAELAVLGRESYESEGMSEAEGPE